MGKWLSPISQIFNKKRDINPEMSCPWTLDCPSHVWEDKNRVKHKRAIPLKPKLRLVERIQPLVGTYKCDYCRMITILTSDGKRVEHGHESYLKNPSLIGGRKSI